MEVGVDRRVTQPACGLVTSVGMFARLNYGRNCLACVELVMLCLLSAFSPVTFSCLLSNITSSPWSPPTHPWLSVVTEWYFRVHPALSINLTWHFLFFHFFCLNRWPWIIRDVFGSCFSFCMGVPVLWQRKVTLVQSDLVLQMNKRVSFLYLPRCI